MIIREAIAEGAALLTSAGIETSSLDASLLLAHVLGTSRSALAAMGHDSLSDEAFTAFRAFIDRRKKGECIAYIIGIKEFWALEFNVNPSVLVPRPDTETLVEAALTQLAKSSDKGDKNRLRALDLCTGSGAVAISIKHEMPQVEVCASDISSDALETAKTNAQKLLSGDNPLHFYLGDLFDALPACCANFSLIVCNPPYIPTDDIQTLSAEVQKEPRLALDGGKSGLKIIERIINRAPEHLQRGGCLLLEGDPRQMKDIALLLEKNGFAGVNIYKDLSGLQRVIGGTLE